MIDQGSGKKAASRRLAEINRAITTSLNFAEVLDLEAAAQQKLGASVDHAAAVEAFLLKEHPVFVGH